MMIMTSSSSSSSSATVAVDKATSELLMNPDWTMNIDICDSVNSHQWQAKDVVKAVKKRLQHKNAKVQLLALTLLETMVKNCGDYVHFQIAERNVLGEMVKIVKKKADMQVRDKILSLLDSWQEAFGGPGGKHPQYYYACDDLRRSGVQFPKRSPDAAPIFTPPVTHPTLRHTQAGYGMPSNSSRRLDETMATEIETISLSSLDSMRDVMELLSDMLQAVNPSDRGAVKDEVILDLVNRCRSNQKKLMQMLTTTGDEELLGQGLELNDSLQTILAKYDAIAFGSPLPTQVTNLSTKPSEVCASSQKSSDSSTKPSEASDSSRGANGHLPAPVATVRRGVIDEEEEEEDDFAQLARRHSKPQPVSSQNVSTESSGALVPVNNGNTTTSSMPADSTATPSNALALPDPPVPVRTTKEQDMIDLLSITLSTASTSPHTPHTPSASNNHSTHQVPTLPNTQGHPYASQTYPANQGQGPYSNYVAPWAQPQSQPLSQSPPQPQPQAQPQFQHPQSQSQSQFQPQSQPQFQLQSQPQFQPPPQPQAQPQFQHPQSQSQFQPQSQSQFQPQSQPQFQPQSQPQFQPQSQPQYRSPAQPQYRPQAQPQFQTQSQPQFQPQSQAQYSQYSSAYPPPPWATTPGYYNNQNHQSTNANNMYSTPQANTPASYTPVQGARPLQHYNSFPIRGSNGSTPHGDPQASSGPRNPSPTVASKPFIPSYRLFEDLNVLGNGDGRYKMTGSTKPGLSGTSGPSMVGGRK